MTFRSREDNFPASEELTDCYPSGSILFNHPSVVAHWNQSVPFGEFSLPTPPDTSSECTQSEYQDMSSQPWSQPSLPEEWMSLPAPDHSTLTQPSGDDWNTHGVPVTTQDIHARDTAAWLSAAGPVDLGLSPVLSHESQSSHTLHSFSEPDTCVLPPGLDLSFTAEPSWYPTDPVVYTSSNSAAQDSSVYGYSPSYGHNGCSMECSAAAFQNLYPGSHPSFYPQGGQVAYQRRTVSYPSAPPMRTLLPRTESLAVPTQPAYGSQRALRPYVNGSRSVQSVTSSVCSSSGQPPYRAQITTSPSQSSGHHDSLSRPQPDEREASSDPARCAPSSQPGFVSYNKPVASVPIMSDPTAEDFSAFIHYDQEEYTASPGDLRSDYLLRNANDDDTDVVDSYFPGQGVFPEVQVSASGDVKPVLSKLEQDVKSNYRGPNSVATSLTSDSDEGRHRTDPLYSRGPNADGLYYCPFKDDKDDKEASCQHNPTKLKCNYDKFIDSHLKPFRCHKEACSKNEFSSTACLLRHEREAHGMHGHGDRPHLCNFAGCERSIPGNGFPRRYNLFDHMRRVHDYKDGQASSTGSPVIGDDGFGPKKTGGRKRKASASPPLAPSPQRQKATLLPPQQTQPTYHAGQGYFMSEPEQPRRDQHRQRALQIQWAKQRELLAKQMSSMESPEDEAGLQMFSQSVQELRRLSAEARRH